MCAGVCVCMSVCVRVCVRACVYTCVINMINVHKNRLTLYVVLQATHLCRILATVFILLQLFRNVNCLLNSIMKFNQPFGYFLKRRIIYLYNINSEIFN